MKLEKDILKRYAQGTCTEEEKAIVEEWFEQYEGVESKDIIAEDFIKHLEALDRRVYKTKVRSLTYLKWGVAAAIVLMVSITGLLLNKQDKNYLYTSLEEIKAPTASNAVIILDDKSEYNLDSLNTGDTLHAVGYRITRLETGELYYIRENKNKKALVYNTLKTKAGGTTHVVLADGTSVWLNANSEMTYPIEFGEELREVHLQGEGYFEVTSAMKTKGGQAFVVRGKEQTIKVMGTAFNANFGKRKETVLIEGSVYIADEGSEIESKEDLNYAVEMKPYQLYKDGKIQKVNSVERFIDWKEGYFDLNEQTIYELAEKISDWYGVDVQVEKGLEKHTLFGQVSRNRDLKTILELIAKTAPVDFELNKDRVYIKSN